MTHAPTFREIFQGIWTLTSDVLRHAPRQALIAFVIFSVAELVKVSFPESDVGNRVLRELVDLLKCAALVPINIALYRLLLLAERSSGYSFDWSSGRFRSFLIWSLVFQATVVPFMLFTVDGNGDLPEGAVAIALLLWLIVVIYVGLRLALLLPALAGSPGDVSWRDAWADSQGRMWRLLKIFLVPSALIIAIVFPAVVTVEYAGFESGIADLSNWRAWVRAIFEAVLSVIMELLALAAGALTFKWVGDRVKRPLRDG